MASSAIPATGASTTELPWLNVMDYGAVADDSTDNTVAFNNALIAAAPGETVFAPPGTYVVNGDINVPAYQFLTGSGNWGTAIHVKTNSQTQGLINLSLGSALRNISISYDQPAGAGYTGGILLIHYKPAIYIDCAPIGAIVENVRIVRAWDGIKTPNGGRTYFRNIEMSMFNRGIDIDGAQDTVRIENLHVWNFGLTDASWTAAFYAPGHSVALYIGRCDGLHIHSLMAINGCALDAHLGASGPPYFPPNIYFSDCIFDSFASVQWSAGIGSGYFANCFFSSATEFPDHTPALQNSFVLTDGRIMISNSQFFGLATGGLVQVNGGDAKFSNCRFTAVAGDQPMIAESAGAVQVNGSYFDRPANTTYATPIIKLTGGNTIIANNIVKDKGTGTGDFIKNTSGGVTTIVNNIYTGWTIS